MHSTSTEDYLNFDYYSITKNRCFMWDIKKLLLILPILSIIPSALAIDIPDVSGLIGNIGSNVWNMLQNDMTVFFFTFIFFFVLLYGIYAAALRKVKVFSEGDTISRQGKLVAVSFAMLSSFAIFFVTREQGIRAFLENILEPLGLFAGVLLGITVFSIIYFGFKGPSGERNWKAGMAAAGLGMIVAGMIIDSPGAVSWGWLLIIIAAIFALIGLFGGGRRDRGRGDDDNDDDNDDDDERESPDFTRELNELENLLQQYENEFNNEFVPACNDVLQTHHDHVNSGGYYGPVLPDVSGAQWNRLIQSANRLAAIADRINQLFDQIRTNPNFRRITHVQNTRLVNLTARRTTLITNMQNFYLDFLNKYRNADPPAP